MAERLTKFEDIELTDRSTLRDLLKKKKLYELDKAADIADRNVRYIRKLCHVRAVDHYKLLGRYYMSPKQVADLLVPVPGVAKILAGK